MATKCSICRQTALEKIEEEAKSSLSGDKYSMNVDTGLGGVPLCDDCKEVLRQTIPAVLEELGILEYDDNTGFKLKKK